MAQGWRGQYSRYKDLFLNVLAVYKKRSDLRMFLEVILTLASIIIFSMFALKPTILTIIALVKEIKEKENTIALLDQKIANLSEARLVFDRQSVNFSLIEEAIPTNVSPENMIRQIEGVASRNSVRILGLSIGEITVVGKSDFKSNPDFKPLPNGASEMPLSVSLTGSYQSLSAMLRDMENLRIPLKVDAWGITSSSSVSGKIISVTLSGRIPFLKNEI